MMTTGKAMDLNCLGLGAGAGLMRTGSRGGWRRHANGQRQVQRSPGPSTPRCGAVPPTLPPGWADGDDGDRGARAAAHGNAGNGNPLRNNDTANAAAAGKVDDAGQENNDRGGDDGDDDEDNDKWGTGA